ncbi:MAG: DUF3365 domain-containing protein [Gammaproteobacteria bacterium]|nr:DUF3365 domain-containing protein [Gammaproteobacteria bacterium]MDE0366692.1 DUF3365 domain-containing protein [Gammaproteobacteria bacterium]
MRLNTPFLMVLVIGLAVTGGAASADGGIGYRQVADMLYEQALANRTVYTKEIIQRLTVDHQVLHASEDYMKTNGLPLPAQMFRASSEELLGATDTFWLSLRAVDPINLASGPITPVEEEGLRFVLDNPSERFYAQEKDLSGRQSYVAVYPDVATAQACVSCHNGHPSSPRRDFKLGDVMGGIVIRLFIDEE